MVRALHRSTELPVVDKEHVYNSAMAFDDLDGIPDDDELLRLVRYYPTYERAHRKALLRGIFDGKLHTDLVLMKLQAKGIEYPISKQSKGGHGLWVASKVRRAVIRLLYLRYRLDSGWTRRRANQVLFQRFTFTESGDFGQSSIRKATQSPVLDCVRG